MALTLDELREMGVTYFASGSNAAGEIMGLHEAGADVGVAVQELNEDALYALTSLAGTGRKVFVDSGAFSEVKFGTKGPSWPHPISDTEWGRRLDVYQCLTEALGNQVYLVAPDRVADQQGTFVRQAEWALVIRELHELGANILVPLQKGGLSLHAAQLVSERVLELDDIIPAIPMKKDATSFEDLGEYLRAAKPKRVHLLGLGAKGKKIEEALQVVHRASSRTQVFCDSVLIRSMVGRREGVRKLTREQDFARGGEVDAFGDLYHAQFQEPDYWLSQKERRQLAKELRLDKRASRALVEEPTRWLDGHPEDEPYFERAWLRYFKREHEGPAVKRLGVRRALSSTPLRYMPSDEQYMFEGARTSPEDWEEELGELAGLLAKLDISDDWSWPLGRYGLRRTNRRRLSVLLDDAKCWRRAECDAMDELRGEVCWETVMASQRQEGVEVVLVLVMTDNALVAYPELRRDGEPLEVDVERDEDGVDGENE
jgi:hypothetical protein